MMKKITYIIALLIVFASCEEREKVQIDTTASVAPTLSVAAQSVTITEENLAEAFEAFTWSAADFGFQSADAEYTLQMDLAGNSFATAITVGITNELELEVTNETINQKLLTIGAAAGTATDIEFRLSGKIHERLGVISNTIIVNITPVEVVIDYPKLYITGDHNDWGFSEESAVFSVADNGIYEGYVYMDTGESWTGFKLSYDPNWDNAASIIGDPDASGTTGTIQVGDWGGNPIFATEGAGVYKVVVNINTATYSVTKMDWAITGDFSSWAFVPMTYDVNNDVFTLTTDMTAGQFKFIANEDWAKVLGDDEGDGKIDKGHDDNNIVIGEDGNYTIVLDLSEAVYTYSVTKN